MAPECNCESWVGARILFAYRFANQVRLKDQWPLEDPEE